MNIFLILASVGVLTTAEYQDKIDTRDMVIVSAFEELLGDWTPEKMIMHGKEVNVLGSRLVFKDGRGVVVHSPETKELIRRSNGESWNTPYKPIGVADNGVLMITSHYVRHGKEARIQGQYLCLFAINDDGVLVRAGNVSHENGASTVVLSLEPGEGKVVVYYRR